MIMSTIFNTYVNTNHTHKEAERQSASEQQNVQQAL